MDNTNDQNLSKKERRALRRTAQANGTPSRMRSITSVLTWTGVGAAILVAVWGLAQIDTGGGKSTALLLTPVSAADWIKGNASSPVTLVEYGDFQCPACATYFPLIKQLEAEFGTRLAIAYRHFPLRSIHERADITAQAAEAAGNQGKFWEMHDLLYERQNEWVNAARAEDIMKEYATFLKLDRERFDADLNAMAAKAKINAQLEDGLRSGVNSTPSFFLNGTKIVNPRSYAELAQAVASVLDATAPREATSTE